METEKMMAKLEVYLNEYNVLMDNTIYFPLASGQLRAYAETKPVIRENYQFMPFLFIRDYPDHIVAQYRQPAVAGFSASMWNINLSLAVAKKVKERFPHCLIVFGAPQVPLEPRVFFHRYPFVDVTVRGEGEHTLAEVLIKFLETRDFRDIAGICYRSQGRCVRNDDRSPEENLDAFPSPYLKGLFDYLMPTGINFQAIIETNRGCPFRCSYCFWGQGKQYRLFSLDRVKELANWCGANRIQYVFCADSNFGMLKRDLEIVGYFVQAKAKYAFPEKFRACYGKNAEDTIYQIGKLLTEYRLEKGITLSRQSNDAETLKNVRRKNIKKSVYNNLQKRYNEENIPVYTELILGLPGETYQSFLNGIEEILQSGIKNQLIVYICEVYPNTELASPEYQERFKISTVRIPLTEIHGSVRPEEMPREYNEIVVSTASMPTDDWKQALVISWIMQLLHGLKLGFFILLYLVERHHIKFTNFFDYIAQKGLGLEVPYFRLVADSIAQAKPRGCIRPDFGRIYWEPEEATYLSISKDINSFYQDINYLCQKYLQSLGLDYDEREVEQVIEYQKARIPGYLYPEKEKYHFEYNIPEYFDRYFTEMRCGLVRSPQIMTLVEVKDYKGDKEAFAREVVIYGRKSDKMLRAVRWQSVH